MSVIMRELDEFPSFDLSLELFGAHWQGNRTERDACIAEDNDTQLLIWDRTSEDLALVRALHGDETPAAPDWWALTWVRGAITSRRPAPHRAVA